jgi:hypothetical protein
MTHPSPPVQQRSHLFRRIYSDARWADFLHLRLSHPDSSPEPPLRPRMRMRLRLRLMGLMFLLSRLLFLWLLPLQFFPFQFRPPPNPMNTRQWIWSGSNSDFGHFWHSSIQEDLHNLRDPDSKRCWQMTNFKAHRVFETKSMSHASFFELLKTGRIYHSAIWDGSSAMNVLRPSKANVSSPSSNPSSWQAGHFHTHRLAHDQGRSQPSEWWWWEPQNACMSQIRKMTVSTFSLMDFERFGHNSKAKRSMGFRKICRSYKGQKVHSMVRNSTNLEHRWYLPRPASIEYPLRLSDMVWFSITPSHLELSASLKRLNVHTCWGFQWNRGRWCASSLSKASIQELFTPNLYQSMGLGAVVLRTVYKWHKRFAQKRMEFFDNPRSGRPWQNDLAKAVRTMP